MNDQTPIQWFDWNAVRRRRGKNLPHFQQEGVVYFVTFRLWDSLPGEIYAELVAARDLYLKSHPLPHSEAEAEELRQTFALPLERYLDEGHGSCLLRRGDLRDEVLKVITKFDGVRYDLGDYVIMPNHMHLLMRTRNGHDLEDICYRWKNISATTINRAVQRSGRLWQVEAFDHIVRSPEKLREYQDYIRGNPRGLREEEYSLGQGCLFRE